MALCNLTLTVADKVTIRKDREFEVVTVNRECNSISMTTQTPVSMEGNPAGIFALSYPAVQLQLSDGSRMALRVEGGEEEEGEEWEGAEAKASS